MFMNTYDENLQQTVTNTLAALSLSAANLDSAKTIAEITLYEAQGAEVTAREKLKSTRINEAIWQGIKDQARYNDCQVVNLLASAAEANTDVSSGITNAATAASNVQIASNAISMLAADIGAALNIATASLYDTDVYDRIVNANSFINEVANESKRVAKNAMNASAFTSEITTTEVLAQTQATKSKLDNIFKSAQSTLGGFANLAIAENSQITQASQTERQAEGGLEDADREVRAVLESYRNANNQLNQGLKVTVVNSREINVSFSELPNPLPTFKSGDAAKVVIPPADPKYFLALLPAQNQSTFSLDQAQQIFSQSPNNFYKVEPTSAARLANFPNGGTTPSGIRAVSDGNTATLTADGKQTQSVEVQAETVGTNTISLVKDVNGNDVNAGWSYVAYLYIELSKAYQQFVSNFSDLLSAPSQPFVPATTVPSPYELNTKYATDEASGEVLAIATMSFVHPDTENTADTVPGTGASPKADANSEASADVPPPGSANTFEYRCILLETTLDPNPDFLLCVDENNNPPLYFNLNLAENVSPANYTVASGGTAFRFVPGVTDNFGNVVQQGVEYRPYVLAIACGDNSAKFVNVLAGPFPPLVVWKS
jgi:hypothetical protein